MKWSYISAQKLESERSKSFAVSILLQTKDVGGQFRVPGTGKYHPSSGKFHRSWSKSRRAYRGLGYSLRLKVKWGNISAQKLETECLKSLLCPFHCKTRPSRLSLASKGLEISPKLREIHPKLVKITMRLRGSRLLFQS